jgi:hypothetical protein
MKKYIFICFVSCFLTGGEVCYSILIYQITYYRYLLLFYHIWTTEFLSPRLIHKREMSCFDSQSCYTIFYFVLSQNKQILVILNQVKNNLIKLDRYNRSIYNMINSVKTIVFLINLY